MIALPAVVQCLSAAFLDLPMESSRHGEILGRSSAGAGVAQRRVLWLRLWLWLMAAAVRASARSSSHRSASSQRAPAQRRRRNNPPTPQIPPPLRQHTTTAPPALNIHNPPPPLRPVVLVSLRPACILRHALSQGRARMCLPTPAAPSHICAKRAHRPSILSESAAASTPTKCIRDGTHS